jgi:D-alanyl-D-alanine carboxypeptidase (penicillin-binding protein 5/6)
MFVTGAAFAAQNPPKPDADTALVAEAVTGDLLWTLKPRRKVPIASITKIMTALVVLDRTRLKEKVVVSEWAAQVGEATANLRAGEELTVEQLLSAMLVESANDAANALADHVGAQGGVKRFVRLMNRKAEKIGLTDTTFVRPDGLDVDGHVSSARDVMLLARRAMQNADFRQLVQLEQVTLPGNRQLETTNDLLRSYAGLTGVKTGHTSAAGWSQVGSARRDGVQLYAVVLGGTSREQRNSDLAALLDWGFEQFGRVEVISAGTVHARSRIPFQDDSRLELVADRSVSRIVQWDKPLVERVRAPAMVSLPVIAGQPLGSLEIVDANGEVIAERPLIATESIAVTSIPDRTSWYLRRALDNAGDALSSVLGLSR